MTTHPVDSDNSARTNMKWLFVLRNLMIGGEALTVLISVHGLDIPLRQPPLWGIMTAMAFLNWLTLQRLGLEEPVTDIELFIQLSCDVLAIAAILYYTGGATNPIAWFFLLPLIIAATVLPQTYTWYMVIFASSCYTILMGYYQPLPKIVPMTLNEDVPPHLHAMMEHHDIELHVFGMWFGFVFTAVLVAYFVVEMAETLRERERKLAEIREQALRNERVVSLGTLAAGAAHEMGTPLGTMAILIHDLEQEFEESESLEHLEKMRILRAQVNRCKEALSVMSATAGELRAESGHVMPVSRYIEEVIASWRQQRLNGALEYINQGFEPSPNILAERTLTHALVNILNNAADVSPTRIELRARWTLERAVLEIADEGPGIAPSVSARLGKTPVSSKEHGLGVGLFLAFSAIERMGGAIEMHSRGVGRGTVTRISLPLSGKGR
ncbi:MAG: HAMP domain-containing histidine kinase [Methylococcaceae bacterium]|nr:HAMP domain-containing histidine kinase [Methylococcaceae bacterium]